MGSFTRTFIPMGLAIAFGIWNGYYAFGPILREHHEQRTQSIAKDEQQQDKLPDGTTLKQQR
ncbi:hypothetical protein F4779DRAFT_589268 [Xylariaceae sp. FL0662B]|nr:hypothetical protein F4779DRAFT_589268 [Xylariaceae sp. FL0662B]